MAMEPTKPSLGDISAGAKRKRAVGSAEAVLDDSFTPLQRIALTAGDEELKLRLLELLSAEPGQLPLACSPPGSPSALPSRADLVAAELAEQGEAQRAAVLAILIIARRAAQLVQDRTEDDVPASLVGVPRDGWWKVLEMMGRW